MTDPCPPCNLDCNQGRDCPARKRSVEMTRPTLGEIIGGVCVVALPFLLIIIAHGLGA